MGAPLDDRVFVWVVKNGQAHYWGPMPEGEFCEWANRHTTEYDEVFDEASEDDARRAVQSNNYWLSDNETRKSIINQAVPFPHVTQVNRKPYNIRMANTLHAFALQLAEAAVFQAMAARNSHFSQFVHRNLRNWTVIELNTRAAWSELHALDYAILAEGDSDTSDILTYSAGWLCMRAGLVARALGLCAERWHVENAYCRAQLREIEACAGAELDGDVMLWQFLKD